MRIRYELSNYRCFDIGNPLSVTIAPGFTSLVGVNNAGKSTLLRSIYELRSLFQQITTPSPILQAGGPNATPQSLPVFDVADPTELFNDGNAHGLEIRLSLPDAPKAGPTGLPVATRLVFEVARDTRHLRCIVEVEGQRFTPTGFVQQTANHLGIQIGPNAACDVSPYYEAASVLASSLYLGAFRNALNVGAGNRYYDLDVGQQFIARWDNFKSGGSKSDRAAALKVQRDLGSIFRLPALELNASQDNETLLVSIGDESYKLQEQGAGFAQFLIVLAYVATQQPALILIDEPELNLHPSLQIDFLNTLTSLASFGVVFATHSLGLARAGSDRVYSVHRLGQGSARVRELEATPNLGELLGELSLAGYQELGSSTVLLVEGPSELRTLQRLLRLYRIEHQVVLLPLGGGALIKPSVEPELREVFRLADSVFALIDSERREEGAELDARHAGFAAACESVGIPCHVLERRAIENYFTTEAIQRAKGEQYHALGHYELLKDAKHPWSKANDNWRIAGEMRAEELANTDLGQFLATLQAAVRLQSGNSEPQVEHLA